MIVWLWVVRYRKVTDDSMIFALGNWVVPVPEIRNAGRVSGLREADHELNLVLVECELLVKHQVEMQTGC